jgi:Zn-dependent protease
MLVLGRFSFVPGFWLGYLVLILVHEMGHAVLSRQQGLRATSIEVHAFGGQCRYSGVSISAWQRSVIAWGGVLGQAFVLAMALPIASFAPLPQIAFVHELLDALVSINLMLIVFNLIPFAPLDGAEAWKIFRLIRERRGRFAARQARERIEVRSDIGIGKVDEERVRETVRRALAEAARDSRNRKGP